MRWLAAALVLMALGGCEREPRREVRVTFDELYSDDAAEQAARPALHLPELRRHHQHRLRALAEEILRTTVREAHVGSIALGHPVPVLVRTGVDQFEEPKLIFSSVSRRLLSVYAGRHAPGGGCTSSGP